MAETATTNGNSNGHRKATGKVRVAVIGVGNCASALVQGVHYYRDAKPDEFVPGLMHTDLGGYHISDIEFSAAFDVDSDKVGHDVARLLIEPSATRDRLTAGMYLPKSESDVLGAIEAAVEATLVAEPIDARIREAQKSGRLSVRVGEDRPAAAQIAGVINAEELIVVRRAKRLLEQVIRVDDFAQDLGVSEMRPPAATTAKTSTVAHKEAA